MADYITLFREKRLQTFLCGDTTKTRFASSKKYLALFAERHLK
jgi:hypothetical protein